MSMIMIILCDAVFLCSNGMKYSVSCGKKCRAFALFYIWYLFDFTRQTCRFFYLIVTLYHIQFCFDFHIPNYFLLYVMRPGLINNWSFMLKFDNQPGINFTNGVWAHNWNLKEIFFLYYGMWITSLSALSAHFPQLILDKAQKWSRQKWSRHI